MEGHRSPVVLARLAVLAGQLDFAMTPGVVGAATRAPHLPKDEVDTGSLVSFARSGIAAQWNASAYQSILELAEACEVPVRWSCRSPASVTTARAD